MKLEDLLIYMLEQNASDLHLTAGLPPQLRIYGELVFTEFDLMDGEEIKNTIYPILTDTQIRTFEQTKELDIGFGLKNISRFRLNLFYQRGTISASIRAIPYDIPSMEELRLPPILRQFTSAPSGLFLVTGPTGCGKSTTLASMIEYINQTRKVRIITVEDPIEYTYRHKKAVINQREVGNDTDSFANALKHVFRQDPDIVLVGEMRDLETIQTVLTLAETGHLIFSTLHTRDTVHAISRIVDTFPPHQQQQIRLQLSMVLLGVITQQLVPRKEDRGRILAYEFMNVTPAIRNLIRENALPQIYSYIQGGSEHGMKTMNQSLAELYKDKLVSLEEILKRTEDVKELRSLLQK